MWDGLRASLPAEPLTAAEVYLGCARGPLYTQRNL